MLSVASRCPHCRAILMRTSFEERGQEPMKIPRGVLLGAGAVLVVLLAGFALVAAFRGRARPLPHAAVAAPPPAAALQAPSTPPAMESAPDSNQAALPPPAAASIEAAPPAAETHAARESAQPAEPAAIVPPITPSDVRENRWTLDWVNVREGPGLETASIRVLPPGKQVEAGERQSGWRMVYLNGSAVGWVANSLLGATPPADSLPTTRE